MSVRRNKKLAEKYEAKQAWKTDMAGLLARAKKADALVVEQAKRLAALESENAELSEKLDTLDPVRIEAIARKEKAEAEKAAEEKAKADALFAEQRAAAEAEEKRLIDEVEKAAAGADAMAQDAVMAIGTIEQE